MEWIDVFPMHTTPAMEDIEAYIGGEGALLWRALVDYAARAYAARPTLQFSACSGKPGWNMKLKKGNASFGTFYPEEGGFSVFCVVSYPLAPAMDAAAQDMTPAVAGQWRAAGDYMKLGRWMMFRVDSQALLRDVARIMAVKKAPKAGAELMTGG